MSTVIRLSRQGTKGKPQYRIVVQDKRVKATGKVIENLGFFNPLIKPAKAEVNRDRLNYWVEKGAQVSAAVNKLLN